MSEQYKHNYGLPVVIVGFVAASFLAFVYGYPSLFLLIDASQPRNFEKNVADAMAEGNLQKALGIARRATEAARFGTGPRTIEDRSMAHTVYGRVLLEDGQTIEAFDQLNKALNVQDASLFSSRETRKPYYFAPARLTLGQYKFEQHRTLDALTDFELARPYARTVDIEYRNYHAALHQAYAKTGLWASALEFREPSDRELDDLEIRDLVFLAHICEGNQNWDLVERVAERLSTRAGLNVEAQYLLGRVNLVRQQYATSAMILEQAAAEGHEHASFFAGIAFAKNRQPVRAIQALLKVPEGDLYRLFALAKALKLLEELSGDEQAFMATSEQELVDQLDREIDGMRLLKSPISYDKYRRFTPIAVMVSETHFRSGGRFPTLILWEDDKAPVVSSAPIIFSISDLGDCLSLVTARGDILQLQWVDNLVNWNSIECLPAGAGSIPGWIDTARDWFALRPDDAAQIQEDEDGNAFLVLVKPTWFYSVPFQARYEVGYLLSVRYKGPPGKASVGWQSLDRKERVLYENDILEKGGSNSWVWHAGYMRSQLQWDTMRVQINAMPGPGIIALDDVVLVAVDEPEPTLITSSPPS